MAQLDRLDDLVPSEVTAIQLEILGVIFLTWGVLAIVDAWALRRESRAWFAFGIVPRVRPLWALEWTLGWTFVTFVSWLCLYLGREVAFDPDPIPLWVACWVTIGFVFGVSAYYHWARGKAITAGRSL